MRTRLPAASPNADIHHDPVHGDRREKNQIRLHPGYGCSPDIASTDSAPGVGRGRSAAGAGGVGGASRSVWVACCRRHGWGGGDMWDLGSVRDRGGGTSSPSPSAPPPVAISPRSSARGDPREESDTVARRLHPGYGFPPGITTHGPRPQEGAGEERRRRGWGGGCRGNKVFGA